MNYKQQLNKILSPKGCNIEIDFEEELNKIYEKLDYNGSVNTVTFGIECCKLGYNKAQKEILLMCAKDEMEFLKKKELSKYWEENFYEDDWNCDTITDLDDEEKEIISQLTDFLPRHMDVYDWNLPYAEEIIMIIRRVKRKRISQLQEVIKKLEEMK